MDETKRRTVQFLEKEIKTYQALALFLGKEEIKKQLRMEGREVIIGLTFYKERLREARRQTSGASEPYALSVAQGRNSSPSQQLNIVSVQWSGSG